MDFPAVKSSGMRQIIGKKNEPETFDVTIDSNKTLMLDLVNKVEMFRIVTEKVNQQLVAKKKPPVFKLSAVN